MIAGSVSKALSFMKMHYVLCIMHIRPDWAFCLISWWISSNSIFSFYFSSPGQKLKSAVRAEISLEIMANVQSKRRVLSVYYVWIGSVLVRFPSCMCSARLCFVVTTTISISLKDKACVCGARAANEERLQRCVKLSRGPESVANLAADSERQFYRGPVFNN